MWAKAAFAASTLFAHCFASPVVAPHLIHEKRDSLPHGWVKRYAVDGNAELPMRIALTQNNLHNAHDWLMDVSHPESDKYGRHWSAEDVANAFALSKDTSDAVKAWLASTGIHDDRIGKS